MAEPTTRFTLTTGLSPAQVREALTQRVQPGALLSFELGPKAGDPREFRGEVTDTGFTLVRRTVGRNSFAPVVTGAVRSHGSGAEVDVTMALPLGVTLFVVGWTAVAAGTLGWFITTLPPGAPLTPALVLLPFPVLGPGVGWWVFRREVAHATRFLRACLPPPTPASP